MHKRDYNLKKKRKKKKSHYISTPAADSGSALQRARPLPFKPILLQPVGYFTDL